MIRGKNVEVLAHACLVLFLALAVAAGGTGAGQIVSSSYSVKESTDLGTQVRVTLQFRLTNAGEQRLFVTQMSLQNPLRPARVSEDRGTVILEPHMGTEVTRQFIIGKDEFELMHQSTRPRLALRIQGADGTETTVTTVLMRRTG